MEVAEAANLNIGTELQNPSYKAMQLQAWVRWYLAVAGLAGRWASLCF